MSLEAKNEEKREDKQANPQADKRADKIADKLSSLIEPLGYEVVAVEIQNHKTRTLRVFIDFSSPRDEAVGIEDCVKVTKALDQPLDSDAEIEALFKGAYELEVSSPGVERPLRRQKDFLKYVGRQARIHVYRPLSRDELNNTEYFEKNAKQKHFIGKLSGFSNEKVQLEITTQKDARVEIPFALISKAHLEAEDLFKNLAKGRKP